MTFLIFQRVNIATCSQAGEDVVAAPWVETVNTIYPKVSRESTIKVFKIFQLDPGMFFVVFLKVFLQKTPPQR